MPLDIDPGNIGGGATDTFGWIADMLLSPLEWFSSLDQHQTMFVLALGLLGFCMVLVLSAAWKQKMFER